MKDSINSNNKFVLFVKNFKPKELPFEVSVLTDKEFDFARTISLEDAKLFLCKSANDECISIPSGGYYNFYFSNLINQNRSKNLYLTYYRVGEETDYIFGIFNEEGKLLNSLIISNQIGDSLQSEAYITNNLEIKIIEVKILGNIENLTFTGKRTKKNYTIKDNQFIQGRDNIIDTTVFRMDKSNKYKFIEI